MKARLFAISDKVALVGKAGRLGCDKSRPLTPGVVYCVNDVMTTPDNQFVDLSGVAKGPVRRMWWPVEYFRLVSAEGQQRIKQGLVEIPLLTANMMSDARWSELCKAQADATELVRQGRDDEALALLARVLEHDDPRDWLETCREIVAEETSRARKKKRGA